MLFYVLLAFALAPFIGAAIGFVSEEHERGLGLFFGALFGLIVSVLPLMPVIVTWSDHASDLGKVHAQTAVIEVQKRRIDSLTQRLSDFDYPSPALLNADTPVASVVGSLTDAQNMLARAESERAIAIRSIQARKHGPMSGVVSFVGDYRE